MCFVDLPSDLLYDLRPPLKLAPKDLNPKRASRARRTEDMLISLRELVLVMNGIR